MTLKAKPKICKGCGRETVLWARGLCKSCSRTSNKPPERRSPLGRGNAPPWGQNARKHARIKQVADKRKEQVAEYVRIKREILKENNPCFFCGLKIESKPDVHHLKGRDGNALTDRRYLVVTHRKCHDMYHFTPVKDIPWFEIYLQKVKEIDNDLYRKETWKLDK